MRSERLSGLVVSIANTGDVYEAALVDPGVVLWSSTTTYDGLGRVASSTDRTGGVSESRYNAVGQVVETACKPAIKPTFYAG